MTHTVDLRDVGVWQENEKRGWIDKISRQESDKGRRPESQNVKVGVRQRGMEARSETHWGLDGRRRGKKGKKKYEMKAPK